MLAFIFGVVFVVVMLAIALFVPNPTPTQWFPICSIHCRIEVFGRYQPANLVENLCAVVQGQIHGCLIPNEVEVSPTGMNAAQ